jgi:hypothetical protein
MKHFMLPPLARVPYINEIIEKELYFTLSAPHQYGKTTFINNLAEKINNDGQRYALTLSLSALRENTDKNKGLSTLVSLINSKMQFSDIEKIKERSYTYETLPGMSSSDTKLWTILNKLCQDLDKPLVLLFDSSDALGGSAFLSILKQIRKGYEERDNFKNKFPSTIAFFSMRDIRDYLAYDYPNDQHLASPFNNLGEKLTLSNFTKDEISELYSQHTEETGQVFEDGAIERSWYWTEGQPWLVNAMADDIINKICKKDYSKAITANDIDNAADTLIKGQNSHMEYLLARVKDKRTIVVIEPMIIGDNSWDDKKVTQFNIGIALDLGLIKFVDNEVYPANPIYAKAIIQSLMHSFLICVPQNVNSWLDYEKLYMSAILNDFQEFYQEEYDKLHYFFGYLEAAPCFIFLSYLLTFLQEKVESLSYLYSLGRGSFDIEVKYKDIYYPIKLKVKRKSQCSNKNYAEKGLEEQLSYVDKLGAKEEWLVIFDESILSSDDKLQSQTKVLNGRTTHIIFCPKKIFY